HRHAGRGQPADGPGRRRPGNVLPDGRRQLRSARSHRRLGLGLPLARGPGRLCQGGPAGAGGMTVHTVFIDGAAGTTGLEIAERLAGRAEFAMIALEGERRKDPAARREALNDADFAILCLPDDAAREAVALIDTGSRVRVIDASSAHRVSPGWVFGFPEVTGRAAVASAQRVSNPGCYSTGFIALVAPLVRAGLLPADWPYTV